MLKKRFLLIFLLMAGNASGLGFYWTANCYKAYTEALKLHFNRAHELVASERKLNASNLVLPYIESQSDFIKCFISEKREDLEALKKNNDVRIHQLNEFEGKNPHTRLFVAEYYLQIAVARLKFEEYIGAVYETRKAFRLLEENNREYPGFIQNLRSLGFIHAFVGTAPKNYQWMINLLGFSGTIDQGLDELRTLLDATYHRQELQYLRDETIVLLTFMEMNMIRNKGSDAVRERLNSIEHIYEKPPMLFVKCVFHFANAENDSVIHLLDNRKNSADEYRLSYLDYLEGIAKLNTLDFTAESSFKNYLKYFEGFSFVKSAYQKLAWIELLKGNKSGYAQYIKTAGNKEIGYTFSDEDKQAVKEAQTGVPPNIHLLKSRLLFDGGYYQRALTEIAGKPPEEFPSLRDKIEFPYRLARIFEKTNRKEKAIQYYEQTISNGKNLKYYFAANSALLLGTLYENDGNNERAAYYYRLCLSMRDHEYQNSLDQKAKAGISRVTNE